MPPSPFANPDQRDTLVTGKKAEELHCPGNLALEWLIVSLAGFVPSTSQGARQGGDCSENVRSGSFLSCHSECPSQEPLHSAQSTRADKQIFHFKKGICPLSRRNDLYSDQEICFESDNMAQKGLEAGVWDQTKDLLSGWPALAHMFFWLFETESIEFRD